MEQSKTIENGNTKTFIVPSGLEFTIREQNGGDDDVLSNPRLIKETKHFNTFIQGIVISTDATTSGKLSYKDVVDLKLRDKYVILFMSRIHSMGSNVKFEFTWEQDQVYKYEEDLQRYIFDYSQPIEKFPFLPTDEGFDDQRIKPYIESNKKEMEFPLKSGKLVKLSYLDGHVEKVLLETPEDEKTKNSELKARGLHEKVDGEWIKVQNFKYFSTRDMMEIRTVIKELDPPFNAFSEITNPKTGEVVNYPIIASTDFFYPTEI